MSRALAHVVEDLEKAAQDEVESSLTRQEAQRVWSDVLSRRWALRQELTEIIVESGHLDFGHTKLRELVDAARPLEVPVRKQEEDIQF